MNRLTLIAAMMLLTIIACKKKENTATPEPVKVIDSAELYSYQLSGQNYIVFANNLSFAELPYSISSTGTEREQLTVTLLGLPGFVNCSATTVAQEPPVNDTFVMRSLFATPGEYQLSITSKGAHTTEQKLAVKMTIKETAEGDCNRFLYENSIPNPVQAKPILYRQNETPRGSEQLGSLNIDAANNLYIGTLIYDTGLGGYAYSDADKGIPIHVNCNDRTITIDETDITTYGRFFEYTVSGAGKIDPVNKNFTLTIYSKDNNSNNPVFIHKLVGVMTYN